MADPNPYLQRPGESLQAWSKRLATVDVTMLAVKELAQLKEALRGPTDAWRWAE